MCYDARRHDMSVNYGSTSHFTLPYSHFSTPIQPQLQDNKASLAL